MDENELVGEQAACPVCGNRVMDELVWDKAGELVTCSKCGEVYKP